MTIWKFELPPHRTVVMPVGAKILCCQTQNEKPYLWALVDPEAPKEQRQFQVIPTGVDFDPTGFTYLGSFHGVMGWMVFHLFERSEDATL